MKKLILAVAIFLGASPLWAELMTYQGRLKESDIPVSASRVLLFEFCDAPTAGNCYTTPSGFQSFPVQNGLFKATFTVPTSDLNQGQWFLQVSVGPDVPGIQILTPRERLTAVPYSVFASSAGYASGAVQKTGDSMSGQLTVSGSTFTVIGPDGNANGGLMWVSTSAVTPALFVSTTGRVGVGTTAPAHPVHIVSNSSQVALRVEGRDATATSIYVESKSGGKPAHGYVRGGTLKAMTSVDSSNRFQIEVPTEPRLTITPAGFTGIGTETPAYQLHISSAAGEAGTIMAVSTGPSNLFWVAGDGAHATRFYGDGSGLSGVTGATDNTKVLKAGDTMTGPLHLLSDDLANDTSDFITTGLVISTGGAVQTTGLGYGTAVGNARGKGAVDLQTYRSLPAQVASGIYSVLSGGFLNRAVGSYSSVAGGYTNSANTGYAAVGGGLGNTASGLYSAVGGGQNNTASGQDSFVAGGSGNTASDAASAVGGGQNHIVSGAYSGAFSGYYSDVSGTNSFAGGGYQNKVSGSYSSVLGGMENKASGDYSAVGGGRYNVVSGSNSAVSGGAYNTVTGTSAVIAGGEYNSVSGMFSSVSGGKSNSASSNFAAVGGGDRNVASGAYTVVGGGDYNRALGQNAAVLGGISNVASGNYSVVGAGLYNYASGYASAVPGGDRNVAEGNYSFAAGYRSSSTAQGAFTWTDSEGVYNINTVADRTVFKNRGGFLVTGSTNTSITGTLDRAVFITGNGLVGVSTGAPQAALDVVSTGTLPTQFAQIWRDANGTIVASMTAAGAFTALQPLDGDDLGDHNAGQDLQLNWHNIYTVSTITAAGSITAARYQVNGSTVLAMLPGLSSLAVGPEAGRINTGAYNVFVGSAAGRGNPAGTNNTMVGFMAGYANDSSGNTFIGSMAGSANATGSQNIVIGSSQHTSNSGASSELNIGGLIFGQLGFKTVGISTRVPQAALDVVSTATGAGYYAQIWRDSTGVVVSSVSSQGIFFGNGSGLTGVTAAGAVQKAGDTMQGTLDMGGNFLAGVSTITMQSGSIAIVPPGTAGSNGGYGIAVGSNSHNNYTGGVGVGHSAYNNYSYGVGVGNQAYGNYSWGVGVGPNAYNNHDYGVGLGYAAQNNNNYGMGLGAYASGNYDHAVGIGVYSQNNRPYGSALGAYSYASSSATALGAYAKANAELSLALGYGTVNNSTGTASFGNYAVHTSTAVNAAYYQVNGSTVISLRGTSSFSAGVGAGLVNNSGYGTFVGAYAGGANTGGNYNSFFGFNSGNANTLGAFNSLAGAYAGAANTTGNSNSAFGYRAGASNQTGVGNAQFGADAGYGVASNSYSSTTVMGYRAGYGLTTGSANTLLGWQAGYAVTGGTNNIVIGYGQDTSAPTANNELNIGGLLYGDLEDREIYVGRGAAVSTITPYGFFGDGSGLRNVTADGSVQKTGDVMDGVLYLDGTGGSDVSLKITRASTGELITAGLSAGATAVIYADGSSVGFFSKEALDRVDIGAGMTAAMSLTQNRAGVNNTSPYYTLDVNGPGRFADQVIAGGSVTVAGSAFSVGASTFVVDSGRVGINWITPEAALQVSGGAKFLSNAGTSYILTAGSSARPDMFFVSSGGAVGMGDFTGVSVDTASAVQISARLTGATNGTEDVRVGLFVESNTDGTLDSADLLVSGNFEATVRGADAPSLVSPLRLKVRRENAPTGTVDRAIGLFIDDIQNEAGGTINNTYGIFIGDQSSGAQNNDPYALFSVDPNARSYFAGSVGIAKVAPEARLDLAAAGLSPDSMGQIWRSSDGTIVSSMSATGVMKAARFLGDGSGLTNIPGVLKTGDTMTGALTMSGSSITIRNSFGYEGLEIRDPGGAVIPELRLARDGGSYWDIGGAGGGTPLVFQYAGTNRMFLASDGHLTLNDSGQVVSRLHLRPAVTDLYSLYISSADSITPAFTVKPGGELYTAGRVGIGTGTPQAYLHISSNTSVASNTLLKLEDTGTGAPQLLLEAGGHLGRMATAATNGGTYIGTLTNDFMVFQTNAIEQMRIMPDGKVGLGTGSPAEAFDVSGRVLISTRAGGNEVTDGLISYGTGGMEFYSGGNKYMKVASGGNYIGIGPSASVNSNTMSPRLQMKGSMSVGSTYGTSQPPANSLVVEGRLGAGTSAPDAALSVVQADVAASSYTVHIGTSSTAYHLVVTTGGWVGINTLRPQAPLHLTAATKDEGIVVEHNSSTSEGSYLALLKARGSAYSQTLVAEGDNLGVLAFGGYNGTSGDPFPMAAAIVGRVDGTPTLYAPDMPGRLEFMTAADGTDETVTRMVIRSDGGVGIATGTPQAMLDILSTATVAQVWRDAGGVVRASMTASGVLYAQVDAVSSKVSKTGDNMSGNLTINVDPALYMYDFATTGIQVSTAGSIVTVGTGNGSSGAGVRGRGAVDLQTARTISGQVAVGDFSTLSGGAYNTILGSNTVVAGGRYNLAAGTSSVISGGESNYTYARYSTVGGGANNTADMNYAGVFSGQTNIADGLAAFVGGGQGNTVEFNYGAIAGGMNNTVGAAADYGFVGGGYQNAAAGTHSAVSGGWNNTANGLDAFVGAGYMNVANGEKSVVTGGTFNTADAQYGVITGGYENKMQSGATAAFIGGGSTNTASGQHSVVAGGSNNTAEGNYSFAAGYKSSSTAAGTFTWSDSQGVVTENAVQDQVRFKARGGFLVSGSTNTADAGLFVSGNGSVTMGNGLFISNRGAVQTTGLGTNNVAPGARDATAVDLQSHRENSTQIAFDYLAVISGGGSNRAASRAAVGGGQYNAASGLASVVAGGYNNTAAGAYSVVPGGSNNSASSDYSFAAGRYAQSAAAGAFTWSDSQGVVTENAVQDQVRFKARGGFVVSGSTSTADPKFTITGAGDALLDNDRTLAWGYMPAPYITGNDSTDLLAFGLTGGEKMKLQNSQLTLYNASVVLSTNGPNAGITFQDGSVQTSAAPRVVSIYKPANEIRTLDGTATPDSHLQFFVGANEKWAFEFNLYVYTTDATGTADMRVGLVGPAATQLRAQYDLYAENGLTVNAGGVIGTYGEYVVNWTGAVPLVGTRAVVKGTIENSTTGGTLAITWGQNVSSAVNTTVLNGSYLIAHKLN